MSKTVVPPLSCSKVQRGFYDRFKKHAGTVLCVSLIAMQNEPNLFGSALEWSQQDSNL